MKPFAIAAAIMGTIAMFIVFSPAAEASIWRSCRGWIGVEIKSGVDGNGRPVNTSGKTRLGAIEIGGKGECPNKAKANDCRKRAKDAAIKCAQGAWADRFNRRNPPPNCGSPGTSRPPHGYIIDWGKYRADIKKQLEYTACCRRRPGARSLVFDVYLSLQGDKRCPHNGYVVKGYRVDCTKVRARGMC